MPSAKLIQKLKPALQNPLPPEQDGILLCLDSANVTGDNAKYMNMYNRLARWYDFGERWIARLRYGNSINEMRRSLMDELEWRQDCTTLYVSIGTGTDLNHLPADINLSALDLTGADLSLGMLARCRNVWQKKAVGLDLVHCNAPRSCRKNESTSAIRTPHQPSHRCMSQCRARSVDSTTR